MNRRMMGGHRNIERMMRRTLPALVAVVVAATACRGGSESARDEPPRASSSPPAASAVDRRPQIVILGDSLTAGLGLPVQEAYPSLLQEKLDRAKLNYQIVNAGVSGDTSAGGLSRLDWAMQGDVRILVVALGGNDGLRGVPVEALQKNLGKIIEHAQARHIQVLLAGMEAPPNFGRDYIVSFHKVYPALAQQYHVPLV